MAEPRAGAPDAGADAPGIDRERAAVAPRFDRDPAAVSPESDREPAGLAPETKRDPAAVSPRSDDDPAAVPPGLDQELGPRERRLLRSMRHIQGEALRLFAARGYEHTTVEQIAQASDISPRTFFRYFPTKEDVVLWDEYDVAAERLLTEIPGQLRDVQALGRYIRESIAGLYAHDPQRLLTRQRIMREVPAVRARFFDFLHAGTGRLAEASRQAGGGPDEELRVRLVASALSSAVVLALERWSHGGGQDDLMAMIDQAVDALIAGVAQLQGRAQPLA